MNALQTLFDTWTPNFVMSIFIILLAVKEIWTLFNWFLDTFGIHTKWYSKRTADKNMLLRHEEKLNEISKEVITTKEKINVLSQMIIDMQNKTDATERARLKDRISQAYRYYHEKGSWNKMEKEAFDDLISDYEAHGGKNSFVHEICEPESCTWQLIK